MVPVRDESVGERPFMDLASGYIQRAADRFPQQGDRAPWTQGRSYLTDTVTTRFGSVTDSMRFE